MHYYLYWASFVDIDSKEAVASGCTFGSTWADAMDRIACFYGKDLIDIKLCELDSEDVLEFPSYTMAEAILKG